MDKLIVADINTYMSGTAGLPSFKKDKISHPQRFPGNLVSDLALLPGSTRQVNTKYFKNFLHKKGTIHSIHTASAPPIP